MFVPTAIGSMITGSHQKEIWGADRLRSTNPAAIAASVAGRRYSGWYLS